MPDGEAVACLAGGTATANSPECASLVIKKLAIWLNDATDDKLRSELLRDLPWRIVGTRASEQIERQRAYMAADWAVRFVCPILLRRAGLNDEARSLESHAPVVDGASREKSRLTRRLTRLTRRLVAAAPRAAAHAAARAAARGERLTRWLTRLAAGSRGG